MTRRPDMERIKQELARLPTSDNQIVKDLEAVFLYAAQLERDAGRLADEVAVLVRLHNLDSRSPAADALLDYREPPSSPRADRLAELEASRAELVKVLTESRDALVGLAALQFVAARSGMTAGDILSKINEAMADLAKEIDAALVGGPAPG